jgi:hypothetical protein
LRAHVMLPRWNTPCRQRAYGRQQLQHWWGTRTARVAVPASSHAGLVFNRRMLCVHTLLLTHNIHVHGAEHKQQRGHTTSSITYTHGSCVCSALVITHSTQHCC